LTSEKHAAKGARDTAATVFTSAAGKVRSGYESFKDWISNATGPTWTFLELYRHESEQLGDPIDSASDYVTIAGAGEKDPDPYAEPWVVFTPKDRFGIALSGGGIRSATFGLGLLQGLEDLGVLKYVDYLSTVSGGGYIGGFWSAWRARDARQGASPPDQRASPFGRNQLFSEEPEVRHLREFSRFLLPRLGLLETEFWGAIMTVIGGMIPSLLTAISAISLAWCVWILLVASLTVGPLLASIVLGALVLLLLMVFEGKWLASHKSDPNEIAEKVFRFAAVGASVLISVVWYWSHRTEAIATPDWSLAFVSKSLSFRPAAALASVTLGLLIVRVIWMRFSRDEHSIATLAGFERVVTRMVALATAAAAAATLWIAVGVLNDKEGGWVQSIGIGTLGSAALFAWLRDWLLKPVVETRASSLLGRLGGWLQRATPKVLAWIAFIGLVVLVGLAMSMTARRFPPEAHWVLLGWASGSIVILLLTAYFFDPARVGLHEFYRTRIARCYLGASNPQADKEGAKANRQVNERSEDDLPLWEIIQDGKGPIHLICVAANDLTGDHLASLYRGARSAVLSGNGITLGDKTSSLKDLKLSSALTASAAAFNSEMGRVSMDLGVAVSFLMSALNLRLGLWVPHPDNKARDEYLFPGRFFLLELLGRSNVKDLHLHLSDGGHFENVALYELIRRHCRYIVVSDCGADPDVAFDDLANVLRRVREDFGVEVDLDVSSLRPGPTGYVAQHAVVGEIHYDGYAGLDKGSIIYFKPGLTGDEPPDVLQYRARCPQFPHQATADQFYDEPQWESYRRLGQHAARSVLSFLDSPGFRDAHFVDQMFFKARSLWQPGPADQNENFLEMTARCAELEDVLVSENVSGLAREFFREVRDLAGLAAPQGAVVDANTSDSEVRSVSLLMRLLQVMEDAWVSGEFDRYWSHPLNEGWMTYFHRWAAAPSVRRWWPILAPIYGPEFRQFVAEQLGVATMHTGTADGGPISAQLTLKPNVARADFEQSRLWRQYLQTSPRTSLDQKVIHSFEIQLLTLEGTLDPRSLPVGFALVREIETDEYRYGHWNAAELYVPPWLLGSGIMGRLLQSVIAYYEHHQDAKGRNYEKLVAKFAARTSELPSVGAAPRTLLGPAARYLMVRDIAFYKSRGFEYDRPDGGDSSQVSLIRRLNA
jgi:hypothetical protein